MNQIYKRWSIAITVVALASLSIAAGDQPPTALSAAKTMKASGLPTEMLNQALPFYKFIGLRQIEAEALMGGAIAAVYFEDGGEILLLTSDGLEFAVARLLEAAQGPGMLQEKPSNNQPSRLLPRPVERASLNLRNFSQRISESIQAKGTFGKTSYLVKFPERYTGDVKSMQTTKTLPTSKSGGKSTEIYQDFEGDVWSYWDRTDNTFGQYTWGVRSCDSYSGTYSADAARGGISGALQSCTTAYPKNIEVLMASQACAAVQNDWKAYLSFRLDAEIDDDNGDSFKVLIDDPTDGTWGWYFWGNWAGWWNLTFNLRQWTHFGDLGENYCNTLVLGLASDSTNNSGFGARVDDLYVRYGESVNGSECAIIADPPSGTSPLTVAFRAVTDIYSPDYVWRFGDDSTSSAPDPAHTYTAAGDYHTSLFVKSYPYYCIASTIIHVAQGSCSYSISPSTTSVNHTSTTGSVSVNTTSSCSWSASSNSSWISITSGSSGAGSGTVRYSVAANTSTSPRAGTMTIAGRTFIVNQSGKPDCTYSISPSSRQHDSDSATGSISLFTQTGCQWSASESSSWIHLTSGTSGSASGTINYRIDANGQTSSRTGTIQAANKTFTITQTGAQLCTYSISPSSRHPTLTVG